MAGANSQFQFADLDFADVKTSLINYLRSQNTFKDYNFSGSGMSILLDVLAYNTQYNAYYLNMVGNEMFLDTALQRSSVVSQAKTLNYIPRSAIAPSAKINLIVNQVTDSALTLPKGTSFVSEAINGINYNFVTSDSTTVNVINNTATFNNITIKQGTPLNYSFTVDTLSNPSSTFEIPDQNIDTTTLTVSVQQSGTNTSTQIYNNATDFLALNSSSLVYFLQEGLNSNYEIYFGDGVLGKALFDGNIVRVSYISTEGSSASSANSFVLLDPVSGFANTTINSVSPATTGAAKESIDSIKFQAPKSYAAQNRAVSKEDYITLIQQNKLGISFDAINVWGGQENDPPVYGQVFISLKPAGAYTLTDVQKQRITNEVLKPISVLTVAPAIVDPDYAYIQINANVLYDPKKTTSTASQIELYVKSAISSFSATTLNSFNSTFSATDLSNKIQAVDRSIIANEINIQVQKKFYPDLFTPSDYKLYYGTPLQRGVLLSGVNSSPSLKFRDPANLTSTIDLVYIEEVPVSTGGVESVSVINPGFKYQFAPTITILGDGSGATATSKINPNGTLASITVTNSGNNYTSAVATVTAKSNDTTGQGAGAIVTLQGRYGKLRTYYYNNNQIKTILNPNAGTIDYQEGVITLLGFNPLAVNNELGQFTVSAKPTTTIISSSLNRIITVDPYDPNSILVKVTPKT